MTYLIVYISLGSMIVYNSMLEYNNTQSLFYLMIEA